MTTTTAPDTTPDAAEFPVVLVDDDPDVRSAIKLLFRAVEIPLDIYARAADALQALETKPASCLILDLRMAEMDGLAFQRELQNRKQPTPIIFVSGHATVPAAVQAIRNGALDVIEKPFDDEALLAAVQHAREKFRQWQETMRLRHEAAGRIADLTRREIEVLDLMVTGKRNKDIAEELGISPKTLDIHRANIMEKLQARTTADLVRQRLLDQADPMALPYLLGMR